MLVHPAPCGVRFIVTEWSCGVDIVDILNRYLRNTTQQPITTTEASGRPTGYIISEYRCSLGSLAALEYLNIYQQQTSKRNNGQLTTTGEGEEIGINLRVRRGAVT